jgi:hypothetical protein
VACSIVVEMHDFVDPAIPCALQERFRATHTIEVLSSIERDPSGYPALARLAANLQHLALTEARSTVMQWAYMVPR